MAQLPGENMLDRTLILSRSHERLRDEQFDARAGLGACGHLEYLAAFSECVHVETLLKERFHDPYFRVDVRHCALQPLEALLQRLVCRCQFQGLRPGLHRFINATQHEARLAQPDVDLGVLRIGVAGFEEMGERLVVFLLSEGLSPGVEFLARDLLAEGDAADDEKETE